MKFLSCLLLTVLLATSPSMAQNRLPKPTTKGKNTFGCLVQNEVVATKYRARYQPPQDTPIPQGLVAAVATTFEGQLIAFEISAYDPDRANGFVIYLNVASYKLPATLTLNTEQDATSGQFSVTYYANYADFTDGGESGTASAQEEIEVVGIGAKEEYYSGTLTITHFDPKKRILAGTFAFSFGAPEWGRQEITDGRFDVTYTEEAL